MSHAGEYQYRVVNDDFARATTALIDIIREVRAGR
jgi:guanylate kinase